MKLLEYWLRNIFRIIFTLRSRVGTTFTVEIRFWGFTRVQTWASVTMTSSNQVLVNTNSNYRAKGPPYLHRRAKPAADRTVTASTTLADGVRSPSLQARAPSPLRTQPSGVWLYGSLRLTQIPLPRWRSWTACPPEVCIFKKTVWWHVNEIGTPKKSQKNKKRVKKHRKKK